MRARRSSALAMFAAFGALTALNGNRTVHRRTRFAAIPIWLDGLLASEAPLACALGQVGVALCAAVRLRGRQRVIALLCAIGAVVGFLRLDRGARAAAGVLEQALDEALPHDAVTTAAPPRRRFVPLGLLRQRYTTTRSSGIAYGPDPRFHRLDVWASPETHQRGASARPAPVLIQIHGGGWSSGGNRSQGLPLMATMAEAGWVCVSPRYRLSPRATWPDQIVDVLRAIAWTKEHIAEFGGDPSFVAITGGSAGGHLCALAALAAGHPDFQPGFESIDTSVQAAVPFYGSYDWLDRDHTGNPSTQWFLERMVVKDSVGASPEVFEAASPRTWVRPDAPPFFVLHGTHDALLPVEQARSFVDALRSVSMNPVAYAEVPFGQHSFDLFRTVRGQAAADAAHRFLATIHAHHRS